MGKWPFDTNEFITRFFFLFPFLQVLFLEKDEKNVWKHFGLFKK
jgi:hypothetical protein